MPEEKMKYYSIILAAICVAVFIVQLAVNGFTDAFTLVSSEAAARPWILITSIFLHGSFSHLFFNMFALVLFGLMLEKFVGSRNFLAIFFVTGIIASIGSALIYPASLGASGAVYGVLGTLAAVRPKMLVWAFGVPMPMVAAAAFYLLLDLAGLFFPTNVANAAHIAGLLSGVAIGLLLRKPKEEQKEEKEQLVEEKDFNQWEDDWI